MCFLPPIRKASSDLVDDALFLDCSERCNSCGFVRAKSVNDVLKDCRTVSFNTVYIDISSNTTLGFPIFIRGLDHIFTSNRWDWRFR